MSPYKGFRLLCHAEAYFLCSFTTSLISKWAHWYAYITLHCVQKKTHDLFCFYSRCQQNFSKLGYKYFAAFENRNVQTVSSKSGNTKSHTLHCVKKKPDLFCFHSRFIFLFLANENWGVNTLWRLKSEFCRPFQASWMSGNTKVTHSYVKNICVKKKPICSAFIHDVFFFLFFREPKLG